MATTWESSCLKDISANTMHINDEWEVHFFEFWKQSSESYNMPGSNWYSHVKIFLKHRSCSNVFTLGYHHFANLNQAINITYTLSQCWESFTICWCFSMVKVTVYSCRLERCSLVSTWFLTQEESDKRYRNDGMIWAIHAYTWTNINTTRNMQYQLVKN